MAHGIRLQHPGRAESTRVAAFARRVGAVRRRARASARNATALGVEAPAGAARVRLRGVSSRRAASRLPAAARAPHGAGFVAGAVSPPVVDPPRCARTPSGSHGGRAQSETQESKDAPKREEAMRNLESYVPGPATGAEV